MLLCAVEPGVGLRSCNMPSCSARMQDPQAPGQSRLRRSYPEIAFPGQLHSSWGASGRFAAACRQRRAAPPRVWPFDQAWGTAVDTTTLLETLPSNLFAVSIIPYAGFLYHLTKSKKAPPLMLFGFYFLLVFVFATIPAGIYAKQVYGTSLANVDYLHGSAEALLTVTNLLIVLGLRQGIREAEAANQGEKASDRKP